MKNGCLKRGLIKGLAAALLATSCGFDTGRAVRSDEVREKQTVGPIESYFLENRDLQGSIEKARDKINLEDRIDVEDTISAFLSAGKPAQAGYITVDFDARIADYNNDHIVDFTDFFRFADNFGRENEEYNLVGSNIVDFDDFFTFADQFGKTYNRKPMATSLTSNNGDNIDVGDEAVLNAHATDREGDVLRYNWSIRKQGAQNEEVEVNGGVLRKPFNEAGTYNIFVRAIDSFGAQSNELSKILNVVSSGPVLSLPDTLRFDQWIPGESEGNVLRLTLDDYVSDPNFEDRDIHWDFDVSNRGPVQSWIKGNEFYHWVPRFPNGDYTKKALHLTKDGNVLTINPGLNYNAKDHGYRVIGFNAVNPERVRVSKDVVIDVVRTPEFDDWYDDVVTGNGTFENEHHLNEPFGVFYFWTENGISRDRSNEWPLTQAKGQKMTSEEKSYFVQLAESIPETGSFFTPVDTLSTNNWDEIMNTDENAVVAYIDDYAVGGTTDHSLYNNKGKRIVFVGVNSIGKPNDRFLAIAYHELYDHGLGMTHPSNDGGTLDNITIFSGGNKLEYVPPRDRAVINSYYEGKQF